MLSWLRIHLQCRRPQFDSWVGKICWRRDRLPTPVFSGSCCGSAGKESSCNEGDLGSIPGLGRSSWRRERLPTPVFWPGEFHGLNSPWDGKESDMTERLSLHFTPLHFTIIKETKSLTETLSTKKISGPNGFPVELSPSHKMCYRL